MAAFAAGLMIPPQITVLPIIHILARIGLDHTYPGLILSNLGGGYLSFAVFVYVGFMRSIPGEVIEAARIDGASSLRTWWTIIMPLVRPATATVGIFLSLWIWNDFLNPLLIIGPTTGQTVTVGLYDSVSNQVQPDYGLQFGFMFLAALIPVVGLPARAEAVPRGPHRGLGEMTAPRESGDDGECNRLPGSMPGEEPADVPDLDEVAGHWVAAADLAHLPSLRNQFGQGHVNSDLSSLAWLAAPPYSFGYHTGVLRLDGAMLPAQRFRWKPWGVQREHTGASLTVRTDARMVLAQDTLLWQIEVTNDTGDPIDCTLSQDLFAMVTRTDTGWGWLYDVPWTAGNYHDFMTLERIRRSVGSEPTSAYLLGPGPRRLRLGKPRLPGIQRDADTEPMSLAYELPRHVSQDTVYPHRDGAAATVRNIRCRDAGLDKPILVASAEIGSAAVQ